MLFHVEMTVNLPHDMDAERAARLKADEKAMSQKLQEEGGGGICGGSPATTRISASSTWRVPRI